MLELFDAFGYASAEAEYAVANSASEDIERARCKRESIRADFRAALASAEPARGEMTPAPELADKLSQMAAAIGAWDDDPIMLTDFLCEIGARALLWEAMARITETATLAERLAEVESERDAWRAFAEHQELCSTCGEDGVRKCYDGRTLQDAALRAAAGGEHA